MLLYSKSELITIRNLTCLTGNHDWGDGLGTFTRLILSRDWLGGWLIPQKRSYFALELSQGWWLLAFDFSLEKDIDIEQYKYFSRIAKCKSVEAVIIVTHEPTWVLDHEENSLSSPILNELLEVYFTGKVRLRIAGDLHHYTRHVPMRRKSDRPLRSSQTDSGGSMSSNKSTHSFDNKISKTFASQNSTNSPELIVSGGGG